MCIYDGQDAGDDRVDASGGRMKAVALIEPGFPGHAVEEERIKQKTVAGGEFGIDRFEIAPIVGAEIGRRPHAGEQYGHVPDGEAAHDLRERLARDLRIDPAQHVVGTEFDDDGIGPLRHRPVEAGEPIGSGIPGDPRIGDLDREALGPERLFELDRKGFVGAQAEAGGERIAQDHDSHWPIGCGSGRHAHRDGERQHHRNQRKCLDPPPPSPI